MALISPASSAFWCPRLRVRSKPAQRLSCSWASLIPHTMGRFSASLIQELEELQETGMSREEAELTLLQEKWPQGPDQWLRLLSRKSAVFWWERDLS